MAYFGYRLKPLSYKAFKRLFPHRFYTFSPYVIPAKEAVSQLPRSRTINELKNINKKQIKPLFYKTFN